MRQYFLQKKNWRQKNSQGGDWQNFTRVGLEAQGGGLFVRGGLDPPRTLWL